jgi:hypothetical protein
MRKPKDAGSRKTWLPLTVLRPFGPLAGKQERIESDILAMLGDPDEMPLAGLSGSDYPGVRVVVGAEQIAALSAMLDASHSDPAEQEAAANALALAARDPARHTVIASHSPDDFGVVVFGRSIEYVAGPSALPIAVRYVTEILGACRPVRSEVAADIAHAAVGQVTFGLLNLCARAGHASTMVNVAMASVGDVDEFDPFVLPIEVHLRTTPGTDAAFAKVVADTLGSFEEFVRILSSDEFAHLEIRSPYLPGSLFTRPDRNAPGDTAAHLRAREILRSASLAGRSAAGTHGPMVLGEYDGVHYHAEEADASKLPLYDVLVDPAGPRASDVLDLDRLDPRTVHVEVYPCGGREDLVLVELERTLSVEFDGDDAVILLDVSAPALVGPYDRDGMPSAIAEVMMFQAKVDLESILFDVFDRVRRFKVRFTGPVAVASAIRKEIDQLHGMLDEMPPSFELVRAIVVNLSPRKPKPGPEPTPMTLLRNPVDVDLDELHLHVTVALQRQGRDVEPDFVEVLTHRDNEPVFVDIEDFDGVTRHPFLVLRIWIDEVPTPAVISTFTGQAFAGDGAIFRLMLERSRFVPLERPPEPSGPELVRAVAEGMFTHTSIEVAYLPYLVPEEGSGPIFCNDVAAMKRYGYGFEGHMVILGDDARRPCEIASEQLRMSPAAASFHVGVSDDLEVPVGESVLAKGAPAVVAAFLAHGSADLLGVGGDLVFEVPRFEFVFLFAYAYVRHCLPDAISDAELASLVGRVTNDEEPEELLRTIADIASHVAREIGTRTQVPLYLATARIAAAFRAMSDDRGGFGCHF